MDHIAEITPKRRPATYQEITAMKSVILVTGAASGIGKLSAEALAAAGHAVYATMRDVTGRNKSRADALRIWAANKRVALHVLELDVLSQESADAAVAAIVREQGHLDVVIQNVGHLVIGPTEAFTPEDLVKVFDTNLFGAQRINRAVLPQLRVQESGLMLWISSTTTKGGFPPFMGPYAAAKAAMDSLAVTLSYEIARFGIETSIVVPGAFTRGTAHFPTAGKPADAARVAAYDRYDGLMDQVGKRLSALTPDDADPKAVADEIARIVNLPAGSRPARSVIDFIGDGAKEVIELAEERRIDFARRIGISDLLQPKVARKVPTGGPAPAQNKERPGGRREHPDRISGVYGRLPSRPSFYVGVAPLEICGSATRPGLFLPHRTRPFRDRALPAAMEPGLHKRPLPEIDRQRTIERPGDIQIRHRK